MGQNENKILLGKADGRDILFNLSMANRHGLIAGATGTGKTVTLQTMVDGFSRAGVPVFLADVKGDLSGVAKAGSENPKVKERLATLQISEFVFQANPVVFWDVFGEKGLPAKCTISDLGPVLLSRMLGLNETQEGVLQLLFKVADQNDWLLLDMKDLSAMLKYISENAAVISKTHGLISTASVAAIQRSLVALEAQGGAQVFGEPMLNIMDFMQTNSKGQGQVNILAADKLMQSPKIYSTFLLWMLSELFENLPEAGDSSKPKMAFFFDEAHLLFSDAPQVLLEKIEQVVRLIRSKGVGIYFITQNPLDVPETVLGQLSNRVQHALRAFTPKDQKAVRSVAETMRPNAKFKTDAVITELGVGEALLSFLDDRGVPFEVERTLILPPTSKIGPIEAPELQALIKGSDLFEHYSQSVDRESAFEKLQHQIEKKIQNEKNLETEEERTQPVRSPRKTSSRQSQSVGEAMLKSTARTVGNEIGRQLIRGILGSLLGGRR